MIDPAPSLAPSHQSPLAAPGSAAPPDPWSLQRRDGNNFDFLRLVLAALVVYSHCFQILLGNAGMQRTETIYRASRGQVTGGGLAVDGFFVISGFLIVHSWLASQSLRSFLLKRVLRIYPAFIVLTAACLLIFGPLVSRGGAEYWRGLSVKHVLHMLELQKVDAPLVVRRFPDRFGIDEPTWTISYEFWCYLGVAALGLLGLYRRRRRVLGLFAAALALTTLHESWSGVVPRGPEFVFHGLVPVPFAADWSRLVAFFLAGVCFYQFRRQIPRSRRLFWLSLGALLAGALGGRGLAFLLPTFGAYALLYLAFVPSPRLAALCRRGDLSYGIYLYAWPVQELVVLTAGRLLSPYTLLPVALILTAGIAWLSWNLIEAPCLRLKPRATG